MLMFFFLDRLSLYVLGTVPEPSLPVYTYALSCRLCAQHVVRETVVDSLPGSVPVMHCIGCLGVMPRYPCICCFRRMFIAKGGLGLGREGLLVVVGVLLVHVLIRV